MDMVTAVGLAEKYGLSDKVLRGHLRKVWHWNRAKYDRWEFESGSEQAQKMEEVARRIAAR